MLNCYIPRIAPADGTGPAASKESEEGGHKANGDTSAAKLPEIAISARRDGRRPYDMRQVACWCRNSQVVAVIMVQLPLHVSGTCLHLHVL